MEYEPIQNKKIYEQIAESIIQMIREKQLQPGDKLDSVDRLAENYNVGKSAVREAISGLRSMDIVETKQGRGTYVKSFNASKFSLPVTLAFLMKQEDVKKLYELRKVIESGTAALAAEVRNENDLINIEKALIIMKNKSDDHHITSSADMDFHNAVVHATHNELLINLVASMQHLISETIYETRKILRHRGRQIDQLYIEHERIFTAVKNQEPDLARRYMIEHLDRVNKDLFTYIDKM